MTALEAILLQALEFYADRKNYDYYDAPKLPDLEPDQGKTARAAIEQHRKVRAA